MLKRKINEIITGKVGKNNGINRDEWIESKLSNLQKDSSILDAGAGEGKYKKFCEHLNYTSQDIAEYDGSGDGTGIQTKERNYEKLDIVSDIVDIPVSENYFDNVLCIEVIEHVPDPIEALKEIYRILKKDGNLILTAPFNSLTHYAPYHYSTGFSRYYYQHHLENLGFEIEEIIPNGNYFEYLAQEVRRIKNVALEYSSKNVNIFYKIGIYLVLVLLGSLSKKDKGSHELLNFGYFVKAKKI
jgi:ubiquinone/menaquinone biosynthesis C-methylase UbiE